MSSDDESSYFERERDRLAGEITTVRICPPSEDISIPISIAGLRGIALLEQHSQPQARGGSWDDEGI